MLLKSLYEIKNKMLHTNNLHTDTYNMHMHANTHIITDSYINNLHTNNLHTDTYNLHTSFLNKQTCTQKFYKQTIHTQIHTTRTCTQTHT